METQKEKNSGLKGDYLYIDASATFSKEMNAVEYFMVTSFIIITFLAWNVMRIIIRKHFVSRK